MGLSAWPDLALEARRSPGWHDLSDPGKRAEALDPKRPPCPDDLRARARALPFFDAGCRSDLVHAPTGLPLDRIYMLLDRFLRVQNRPQEPRKNTTINDTPNESQIRNEDVEKIEDPRLL
jgi:hypothetical protein